MTASAGGWSFKRLVELHLKMKSVLIPGVEFWIHPGRLGQGEPSLCLYHRDNAGGSGLLDLLNELQQAAPPVQRNIAFVESGRTRSLKSLQLLIVPERDELRVLSIRYFGDTATIEATGEGLQLLLQAFTLWLAGGEDFGVSPRHARRKSHHLGLLDRESGELWFWGPYYVSA